MNRFGQVDGQTNNKTEKQDKQGSYTTFLPNAISLERQPPWKTEEGEFHLPSLRKADKDLV